MLLLPLLSTLFRLLPRYSPLYSDYFLYSLLYSDYFLYSIQIYFLYSPLYSDYFLHSPLYSDCSTSQGEEVYNTYGQVANWHLLHMYGFAEEYPQNLYDTVSSTLSVLL